MPRGTANVLEGITQIYNTSDKLENLYKFLNFQTLFFNLKKPFILDSVGKCVGKSDHYIEVPHKYSNGIRDFLVLKKEIWLYNQLNFKKKGKLHIMIWALHMGRSIASKRCELILQLLQLSVTKWKKGEDNLLTV